MLPSSLQEKKQFNFLFYNTISTASTKQKFVSAKIFKKSKTKQKVLR